MACLASKPGPHLNDSEAERLLEGNIGEDAAGGVGEQVDVRDVLLLVLLGVGNAAVQVMRVDQLHHLRQDLLAAWRHAVDVLAVALRGASIPILRVTGDGILCSEELTQSTARETIVQPLQRTDTCKGRLSAYT